LLLVPAGAAVNHGTQGAACSSTFNLVFVTDAELLRSNVDEDGWRGVSAALQHEPCARARLVISPRPSEYRPNLERAANYQPDLVIGASLLLRDSVMETARAHPEIRFLLVDPVVTTPGAANLAVLAFREDQAAYLAGALAAMVTRSGIVAGVYGPEGEPDRIHRLAFEHGAAQVRRGLTVLGAYQPPTEPSPYTNPAWGAKQARAFIALGADVIFGIGGTTGEGALQAAAQSRTGCIGADPPEPASSACLLATTTTAIDRAVEAAVREAAAGHWRGGVHWLGLTDGMVGLKTGPSVPADIVQRLDQLREQLRSGAQSTGL
jgi:basic membrane protein A